jgi:hypothetical protein
MVMVKRMKRLEERTRAVDYLLGPIHLGPKSELQHRTMIFFKSSTFTNHISQKMVPFSKFTKIASYRSLKRWQWLSY